MFRFLALILGLGFLYIQMSSDDTMSMNLIVIALVFLVYGLGGAKWVGKMNARYNSNPVDEFKSIGKDKPPPKA